MNAKFVCVLVSNRMSVQTIAMYCLILPLVEHPITYRPLLHARFGILTVALLEILFLYSVTRSIMVSSYRILGASQRIYLNHEAVLHCYEEGTTIFRLSVATYPPESRNVREECTLQSNGPS
jgi:hypothetical protein